MRVIAFDPSSVGIGWAICEFPDRVIKADVITRPKAWPAYLRIRSMRVDVSEAMDGARVDAAVIEVPGPKQAGRNRGAYATPGTYAAAVGVVLAEVWRAGVMGPVVTVESDEWTRSRGGGFGRRKSARLADLRAAGLDDGVGDAGGDRGDAVSLAMWFLGEARIRGWLENGGAECPIHLGGKSIVRCGSVGIRSDGRLGPLGRRPPT